MNVDRAIAADLTFRPIAETVQDTLAWLYPKEAGGEDEAAMAIRLRSGISLDRETALLEAFHRCQRIIVEHKKPQPPWLG